MKRRLFTSHWARTAIMLLALFPLTCLGQTLDDARDAVRVRDYESAFAIYSGLAASGDIEAAYQLASMFRSGRGVEKNNESAFRWMRIAADAGDARAQYNLAQWLSNEDSSEARTEAESWYRKAADQGHRMAINRLEMLDEQADVDFTGRTEQQQYEALAQAAREGNQEAVQILVRNLEIGKRNATAGHSALIEAVVAGHPEIISLLLEHGVDVDGACSPNPGEATAIPLHSAVQAQQPASITALLAAGANPECRDAAGNTTLIIAASSGEQEIVRQLLIAGAQINALNNQSKSAVAVARLKNHAEIEELLRSRGGRDEGAIQGSVQPDLALTGDAQQGWNPLMYAAWRGNRDRVRKILQDGVDVNATDTDGHTALSRAAWRGFDDIVSDLLAAGADPGIYQEGGFTALAWAAQEGHIDVVRTLLTAGVNPDPPIDSGMFPLMLACSSANSTMVDLLLQSGADINRQSPDGRTSLMLVASSGTPELLDQLLDNGAQSHVVDSRGRTAAWYAVINDREDNLSVLLSRGASADSRDLSNQHLLSEAAGKASPGVVEILLQNGVPPDSKSGTGNTALIVASAAGRSDVLEVLLQAGADPDIRNDAGRSALMSAVIYDHLPVVDRLLRAGANTQLVDVHHNSARDIAKENERTQVLRLLDQYEGR